ncbi:cytochrome P450 [Streptomyces viridochromogenes]|uniref:Cytochrome P450 n=1 Tax=Streptomyces viridochromogenes TaxID=1938 RepID=A0A0J7ZHD5_STRVR|nr:cytochrome P450 [Streptomyces viridochromogenes]KMS75299.1 cytochrome P450 [Streptomyces viridochromogenes]KOG14013.1 cytochrome P450 [Streptomyces viridochromogenes]KOG20980.1 cytochrome P450 [Streptomyces viridochromogenes]
MTTRRTIAPEELDTLNLADPRLHAESDLSAVWRHLREHRPVHWNPATDTAPGFWVVSRHADVTSVYRDSTRFTSEGGNVLETLLAGGDTAAGRMLAITDGAKHTGLRRLLMSAFSPRALEPIVESVRRTVTRLLEDALERGTCDFAADVAAGIPLGAICDLLGVPDRDRAYVLSLTSSALGSHEADSTAADAWIAKNEILLYFANLARDRRDSGHADVIALLAGSEVNGLPLDDDEIMLNCYSLILGGDETARLSMVGAALALLDHPDQWQALKRGDAGIDTAVEEILRWTTPALHSGRTATTDAEVGGHAVRAGEIVTVWNASANRDERIFDTPGELRLDRTPNKHVTFAYGPHFCLGAYLARAEIGAVLTGLRDLVAELEQTGPAKPVYSNFLSGLSALPLALKAA